MAKPDGRIEKGQRLSTAISARAWNRAQDAADIVLGARPGVTGDAQSTARLPCVTARFPETGYFGEVRMIQSTQLASVNFIEAQSPSVPATLQSAQNFSDLQKRLLNITTGSTTRTSSSYSSLADGGSRYGHSPLAICIFNNDNLYAISGLAITRVRVFNYYHRHARLPRPFDGQTQNDINNVEGCLDSAFYGPAKIVGYYGEINLAGRFRHISLQATPLVYPNHKFFWALVSI